MTSKNGFASLVFAGVAASLPTLPALAADPTDLEGLLEEKVVTAASKSAETANSAPATTVTVTADQLRRYGLRTVADAIRFLVPGAFYEETPNGSFGARGVMLPWDLNSHVLVLVDGHAINSELDGSADLRAQLGVPIELVDHVEVMLDPGSVLYGSNAMLGVVNVVTSRAQEFHGLHVGVDADVSHQYRAFVGGGSELSLFGKKGELTLGLETVRLDDSVRLNPEYVGLDVYTGQPLRTRADGAADGSWGGTWNSNYAHTTGGYLRMRMADLQLTARAGDHQSNDPTSLFDFDNPDTGFNVRWLSLDVSYQKRLLAPLQVAVRLYGDERRRSAEWRATAAQYCLPGQLSGCRVDSHGGAEWLGMETQAHIDWLENGSQNTLLGIDGRIRNIAYVSDITDAVTGTNPGSVAYYSKVDSVVGAYAQHVVRPLRRVTANVGARLDSYSGDTAFSPRAALIYEPWEGGAIKGIYSSAFRAPPPYTKAFALPLLIVPAHGLGNERVQSFELSLEQRLGTQLLRTSIYHYDWHEMVELVPLNATELQQAKSQGQLLAFVPQAFQYRNAASIESNGFTTSLDGALVGGRLRYGLSFTESSARRRDTTQSEQVDGAPALLGAARISYDLGEPWPTIGLATFGMGKTRVYGVDEGGYAVTPIVKPRVTSIVNLAGPVPGVSGLRYRVGMRWSSNGYLPMAVGPVTHATPQNPSPDLMPLRTFTLLSGLEYTVW